MIGVGLVKTKIIGGVRAGEGITYTSPKKGKGGES